MVDNKSSVMPKRRLRRALVWSVVAGLIIAGGVVGLLVNTQSASDEDIAGRGASKTDQRAVGFVEEQLRAQGTPDAAFGVVRDGQVTSSGTLGDDVSPRTPFLLGSLSKPFTALAIMQLVDAGKVDLDDPVTEHIPWFATADESAVITIRHLLNQTSGLPTWAGQVDLDAPETTLEQRVRAVGEVEPVHEPGTVFEYCNKNFATLGLVVESVTGMSYADYLQQHVFEPLDMDRSFTDLGEAQDAGLVEGASVWFGAHVPRTTHPFPGALPDGYLVSTLEDLAHFAQAQVTGRYRGERIISKQALKQMHSAPKGVAPDEFYDARYALGWRVSQKHGQRVVAHEGELATYRADMGLLLEDGRGLVVLTAHNSMFADLGKPYAGGMAILAGDDAPPVDRGFFTSYLGILVLGAVVLVALLASAVALVGRARNMRARIVDRGWNRAVALPVLGRLAVSAGTYCAVFYALGQAAGQPGFLRLSMAYGSTPDLTAIVLAFVGYYAVAAVVLLVAGVRAGRAPRTAIR